MTIPGVLLAIAFFLCLAVMAYAAREKLIEQPLSKARARRSPIAEFVDDLQQHRWIVIVGLALLSLWTNPSVFPAGGYNPRL